MKLSCSVINDLLPLYAENISSEDTNALVEEHLSECADCREKLHALKEPKEMIPESTEPLKNLKKEIQKRRLRFAGIAALVVFIILFTVIAHLTDRKAIPYSPDLLSVEGIYQYSPAGQNTPESAVAIMVRRTPETKFLEVDYVTDPDTGETTAFLQCWKNGLMDARYMEDTILLKQGTVRVIYGFGENQTLLFGDPMNGGMQILPRLALSYYVILAAIAAIILAVLWIIFRKKKAGRIFRQLFFIPISYIIGHLLVKGFSSISNFMVRDLIMIVIMGAAVYALVSLLFVTVCVRFAGSRQLSSKHRAQQP